MRFLCDEMLGRFARYLRAAGYDTLLAAGGAPDRELLALAHRDHRHFITCDRRIVLHKAAAGTALILSHSALDAAASRVTAALAIDWLYRPFTRCLVDNALLVAIMPRQLPNLPGDVSSEAARHCPNCGRVYWAGSHYRRMRQRLVAWAAGDFAGIACHDTLQASRSL